MTVPLRISPVWSGVTICSCPVSTAVVKMTGIVRGVNGDGAIDIVDLAYITRQLNAAKQF